MSKEISFTEDQLKGCPFCGEKPEYVKQCEGPPEHGGSYWPHQVTHHCKTINQMICVRASGGRTETPEKVFAMWNSRPMEAAERSRVHALYLNSPGL